MNRFSFLLASILALAPLFLVATPIRAGIILLDNREDFLAALTSVTTFDFGTVVPPGQFQFFPTGLPFPLSGVNFTIDHSRSNGNLFVVGQEVYYSDIAVLSSQQSTTGNNNLFIVIPGGGNAVGTGFASFGPSTLTFTLSTGESFTRDTLDFSEGFASFVGVISNEPITSVRIDLERIDDLINIGRFSFGQATAVPEPSSFILFSLGFAGFLSYVWNRGRYRKSPVGHAPGTLAVLHRQIDELFETKFGSIPLKTTSFPL